MNPEIIYERINRLMLLTIAFVLVRIGIIALALLFGYLLASKIVEPYALKPVCLTDTNSCAYLVLYKLDNSFFAQVFPSGLYMWLNGSRLYVYGQAPGTCSDTKHYEVVDRIDITGTDEDTIYTRQNPECITRSSAIETYYIQQGVKPQTIYIRGISPTQTANLNVFEIFQRLIDLGYVSVANLTKETE